MPPVGRGCDVSARGRDASSPTCLTSAVMHHVRAMPSYATDVTSHHRPVLRHTIDGPSYAPSIHCQSIGEVRDVRGRTSDTLDGTWDECARVCHKTDRTRGSNAMTSGSSLGVGRDSDTPGMDRKMRRDSSPGT
jgi:hypothetical protein